MEKVSAPTIFITWLRRTVLAVSVVLSVTSAEAQTYSGEHKFDGTHRNEINGYISFGHNSIADYYAGPTVFYDHHFTPRICAQGGIDIPIGKNRYGISARGIYRLPVKRYDFYFSARFMYNRYQAYHTNEFVGNISVTWEGRYFDITVGESLIGFSLLNSHYTEPLTFTFGAGLNIRERSSSWNIGLFFRNYDDFYYENWNINWGLRWNANLPLNMKLIGEFDLRPAGSLNQLATKYETSVKLGIKYVW